MPSTIKLPNLHTGTVQHLSMIEPSALRGLFLLALFVAVVECMVLLRFLCKNDDHLVTSKLYSFSIKMGDFVPRKFPGLSGHFQNHQPSEIISSNNTTTQQQQHKTSNTRRSSSQYSYIITRICPGVCCSCFICVCELICERI